MNIPQMSITAAILILVIAIIRSAAIHKLPKKTFLVLWGVALFRLLVPFYIPLPFGGFAIMDRVAEFIANGTNAAASPYAGTSGIIPIFDGNVFTSQMVPGHEAQVPLQVSPVVAAWIIGMIGLALFFTLTHLRCRKKYVSGLPVENEYVNEWLKSLNLRRTILVRYSDRISAPMTFGIWKPVILFPKNTDWRDEAQLRYVLTHELIHIKRFDILIKWLLIAVLCVHWFNPLVWVMYILAIRDIELACDEAVVWHFGETAKSAYVFALIRSEERRSGFSPLYNNFAKNAIEERINAIMKLKKKSVISMAAALVMVAVLTTSALTVFAAERPRLELGRQMQNIGRHVDGVTILNPEWEMKLQSGEVRFYELCANQAVPFDSSRFATLDELISLGAVFLVNREGRLAELPELPIAIDFARGFEIRHRDELSEWITLDGELPVRKVELAGMRFEGLAPLGTGMQTQPRTAMPGGHSYDFMRGLGKVPIIGAGGEILMWVPQSFFEMTYAELSELAEQLLTTAAIPQTQETVDILREHWLAAQ